jgi:hypothetical protein
MAEHNLLESSSESVTPASPARQDEEGGMVEEWR